MALRSFIVVSAVTGASAFAPAPVVFGGRSTTARGGATSLHMNAGSGIFRKVAAFRLGTGGKSAVLTDYDSIDLDLVEGTKATYDSVGGVDISYAKPASTFFSGSKAAPRAAPPRAAPRVAAVRSAPAQVWL